MQEDFHLHVRLRFGVFELDLRAGELRKHGLRVRLQEQLFQLLAILLELCGQTCYVALGLGPFSLAHRRLRRTFALPYAVVGRNRRW